MSSDSPEPESEYSTLTPRTEAKYNKIDEDFQLMIQRNQQGARVSFIFFFVFFLNFKLINFFLDKYVVR